MTNEVKQEGLSSQEDNIKQLETLKSYLFQQLDRKYQDLAKSIDSVPYVENTHIDYLKMKALDYLGTGFLYIKEMFQVLQIKPFDKPKVQENAEPKSN